MTNKETLKPIKVKNKFWENSPVRTVYHNMENNTILVDRHTFNWNYFFKTNVLVEN